jgi:hypothetical protein
MAIKLPALFKWTLLVWLNAGFSFAVALDEYPQTVDRVAIVCGVFTFVLLYATVERYLLNAQKRQLSKALLMGVLFKSLFQLYPGIELAAGMLSTAFVDWIMGKMVFVSAYLTTLTDGFLLSLLVAVMVGLINFAMTKFLSKDSVT